VIAAGLSGLAQAVYLASGATLDASPTLRFGIGAWPAVAAAVAAHLLYLRPALAQRIQGMNSCSTRWRAWPIHTYRPASSRLRPTGQLSNPRCRTQWTRPDVQAQHPWSP
jgi:hypothetical protein